MLKLKKCNWGSSLTNFLFPGIFFTAVIFYTFYSVSCVAKLATVDCAVTNMFVEPNAVSKVASQVTYGTSVDILRRQNGFYEITTPDNYQGWVTANTLSERHYNLGKIVLKTTSIFTNVYQDTSLTNHKPIVTLPYGILMPVIGKVDSKWLEVKLVDGRKAYVRSGDVQVNPRPITLEQMLILSKRFLGLPYVWGGVSTYGFDCSGFVQFLYKQIGVQLPRDGRAQIKSPLLVKVKDNMLQPGDIIYFGRNNIPDHAGMYLGNNKFIDATAYKVPAVQINNFQGEHWKPGFLFAYRLNKLRRPVSLSSGYRYTIRPISSRVAKKMRKYTWHKGCPVAIENLVALRLSYWGFDGKTHQGTLIVNKYLAKEIAEIFSDIYSAKFPIEKIKPMYMYKGNDAKAMREDNSSAFNCRTMTDFANQYSIHSYGGAIDINTFYNPYVYKNDIQPKAAAKYVNRQQKVKGMLKADGKVVKAFTKRGWVWGGSWPNMQDYQHFEKPLPRNG